MTAQRRCRLPSAAAGETALSGWVRDLSAVYQWRRIHSRPALTTAGWRTALEGDAGWPDWAMAHTVGRMIVAELKGPAERPTPDQVAWLNILAGVPQVETYLWRPADWPAIQQILVPSYQPTAAGAFPQWRAA